MNKLHIILEKPVETEKAHGVQKNGKFTFIVRRDATKTEIKQAIEKYYGVKVKSVRTSTVQPKTRAVGRGRTLEKRSISKKAIITTVGAKSIEANKVKI